MPTQLKKNTNLYISVYLPALILSDNILARRVNTNDVNAI